jgi:DNA-binding transcriptional MerR regulator
MSKKIITLFGEELAPEELVAVGKSRAKSSRAKAKPEKEAPVVTEEKRPQEAEEVVITRPAPKEKELSAKNAPPEDWQGEKQYYSIGEVAELFKVKTSHIRFWTNEFKLKVRTTRKGDRLYTPAQIRELRAIYHLVKERGFTLSGAKAKLKAQNKMDVETVDLKQSLLQLRNKLLEIRNRI